MLEVEKLSFNSSLSELQTNTAVVRLSVSNIHGVSFVGFPSDRKRCDCLGRCKSASTAALSGRDEPPSGDIQPV